MLVKLSNAGPDKKSPSPKKGWLFFIDFVIYRFNTYIDPRAEGYYIA